MCTQSSFIESDIILLLFIMRIYVMRNKSIEVKKYTGLINFINTKKYRKRDVG